MAVEEGGGGKRERDEDRDGRSGKERGKKINRLESYENNRKEEGEDKSEKSCKGRAGFDPTAGEKKEAGETAWRKIREGSR